MVHIECKGMAFGEYLEKKGGVYRREGHRGANLLGLIWYHVIDVSVSLKYTVS